MKKFHTFLIAGLLFLISTKSFAQGMWTWMGGSDSVYAIGVYGTLGVGSVNNTPPALYSPHCWTDLNGNFWLYAGQLNDYPTDLWKFDPNTLEWTWVKGDAANIYPVYGVQGVPSPTNTPGSREYSGCTWVDLNNNLWLYSGNIGWGSPAPGDLWKYDISMNEWTWMAGSDQIAQPATYGVLGAPDSVSTPGNRDEIGNAWTDANGKFWLYGGKFYWDIFKSDMWMFDPLINQWTWQSGDSSSAYVAPNPGPPGVFSPGVTPGTMWPDAVWTDNQGILWMSGGQYGNSYVSTESSDDLWKYDPTINQWAWVNGNTFGNDTGVVGASCLACESFYPGQRSENRAVWKDSLGHLWMYGGINYYESNEIRYSDMWMFDISLNRWACMQSDSFYNTLPHHGDLGVTDSANHPGPRTGTAHWQDAQGNFWLWGGTDNLTGIFNDMWRYTPDLSCLTFSDCDTFQTPTAFINPLVTKICQDSCISFDNQSTNASSYQWFFPGASPSYSFDQFPANICYQTSGIYDVTLIVYNGPYSDTVVSSNLIEVYLLPTPTVTQTNDTLYCTNAPNNSTYQWYLDNNIISGATDSIYIATANALYSVIVTNADECTGTDEINVIIDGITEIQNQNFQLFPNPADENVTIRLGGINKANIKLYNTLGQIIYNDLVNRETTIDLSKLSSGIYYISVQSITNITTRRLIVTHTKNR